MINSMGLPGSRRLQILSDHLQSQTAALVRESQLASEACSRMSLKKPVNISFLEDYMAGNYRAEKQRVIDFFLHRPDLQTPVELSKKEHRDLCYKQLKAMVNEGNIRPFQALVTDPGKYYAIAEAVGYIDLSLAIKMGVQFRYTYDLNIIFLIHGSWACQ